MGRWGDGEMGRWGDGEMGRWGDGEGKEKTDLTPRVMVRSAEPGENFSDVECNNGAKRLSHSPTLPLSPSPLLPLPPSPIL